MVNQSTSPFLTQQWGSLRDSRKTVDAAPVTRRSQRAAEQDVANCTTARSIHTAITPSMVSFQSNFWIPHHMELLWLLCFKKMISYLLMLFAVLISSHGQARKFFCLWRRRRRRTAGDDLINECPQRHGGWNASWLAYTGRDLDAGAVGGQQGDDLINECPQRHGGQNANWLSYTEEIFSTKQSPYPDTLVWYPDRPLFSFICL